MAREKDEALLRELGLAAHELGEQEALVWRDPGVGHARGPGVRELSAAFLATLQVVPIGVGLLAALGASASTDAESADFVKFVAAGPLNVRTAGAAAGKVFQSASEPNVVWVDARRAGAFVLETASGRLLWSLEEDRVHVQAVVEKLALAPLAGIDEPVEGWMRTSTDAWLQEESARLLSSPGPWSVCVAAGTHARLVEPAAVGRPAELAQALLRGESPAWLTAPRQWVRSLAPEQKATLQRLALAEGDRLTASAEALEGGESTSDAWRDGWLRLCHARDALEGVRVLLAEVGASSELDVHLRALDHRGGRLRAEAPLARIGSDERLRRAHLADPDAWWGWLG